MRSEFAGKGPVLALTGGIGGAKLALGLSRILEPGQLSLIVNTGDDFAHLGLAISPDLDTVLYTLAGIADTTQGWGRRDETWTFMKALAVLGGPTWFQLGDADLAIHVERSRRLAAGEPLSAIVDDFRRRLGVKTALLPMTDDRVRTRLRTGDGWIDFQDYFVRMRCAPAITEIEFAGAAESHAQAGILTLLADPQLLAVIICPSNPLISIEPILAVGGMRSALAACKAPVVAISPIINGNAVKGPTAKMLRELGCVPDAMEAARRYADLLDGYIVDELDRIDGSLSTIPMRSAQTLMNTLQDRELLAQTVLEFAATIAKRVQQ